MAVAGGATCWAVIMASRSCEPRSFMAPGEWGMRMVLVAERV